MSTRLTIPPGTEPVPVTAEELTRHMERLLFEVAPRVVCESSPVADEASYSFIEPSSLIDQLIAWTSNN